MNQDNNTLSVYAHNGDIIGHIDVYPSARNNSLWGSRGEVRRFTIREGRHRLLHEWDHWSQLVLRSPHNKIHQASVAIVAFPTGRNGEGYLRFL
jgi:hypothetical protein